MSDGNWTFDSQENSSSGTGTSGEQNIVDSTAEVVSETIEILKQFLISSTDLK